METPEKIGRYEIKSEIGRGGMATVYHAFDPMVKREVAIKVLPRELLHNPTFRARFQQEAETIARLDHPAIVPLYDFGEENEQLFLVTRLMTGGTLADRLARGPLPLAETSRIIARLAPALDEAHAAGIIHRDLKPANILFDRRSDAYLSDFGIAKLVETAASLTSSGIVGTPAYMAPEMASQVGVSPAVDIYALGVTLYQMLSGQLPFEANTPLGTLLMHLNQPIPDVREVRPELPIRVQTILDRAMAKEPQSRYPSAGALAADLQATLAHDAAITRDIPLDTALTQRVGPATRTAARRRKMPGWLAALIGIGVIVVVGALVGLGVLGGLLRIGGPATSVVEPTATEGAQAAPTDTSVPTAHPSLAAPTEPPAPTSPPAPTQTPGLPAATISRENVLQLDPLGQLSGHTDMVNALAWFIDSSVLASGSADHTIILWDVTTGQPIRTLAGHTNWVTGLAWLPPAVSAAPSPWEIVSSSSDRTAILWDAQSGQPIRTFETPHYGLAGVAWSPDGQTIITAPYYTDLLLWDAATGAQIGTLKGHTDWINTVAYSPNGALIASGARNQVVFLWDALTGQKIRELPANWGEVMQVAWSPDGTKLAAAMHERRVLVWDTQTWELLLTLEGHRDLVHSVSWSPDGLLLASGSNDGAVIVWDAASGEALRALDAGTGPVYSVAFAPDGALLAAGSQAGLVTLWGPAP